MMVPHGRPSLVRPRTGKGSSGKPKSSKMEKADVGMHVDIKRSDGRVHSAIVTELRPEKPAVMVEWFEKNETKGKEVTLDELLQLNPTLRSTTVTMRAPQPKKQPASTAQLPMRMSQNHFDYNNENMDLEETLDDVKVPEMRPSVAAKERAAAQRRSMMPIEPPAADIKRRELMGSSSDLQIAAQTARMSVAAIPPAPIPSGKLKAPTAAKTSVATGIRKPAGSSATTPVDAKPRDNPMTRSTDADVTINIPSPAVNGKSATVQNIEKMQRDREERRAKQEKAKEAKHMNPKDPNYQFYMMIRQYHETIDFRPLDVTDQVINSKIVVCVRKRPMNKKELGNNEIEVITIPNQDHLIVHQPQVKVDLTKYIDHQEFRLDYAFDENITNAEVYRFTAQPLVRTIFEKGNATCFAYGQTGSGKTHTMGGNFGGGRKQDCAMGIYALTAADVFRMRDTTYRNLDLDVYCAFFELYSGKVFDLLNEKALLRVLEDGNKEVNVVGLKEVPVDNEEEVLALIKLGTDIRTAGATSANSNSSRSHAVFQIIVKKSVPGFGRTAKPWGKFSLVDLAGNERGQDTGNSDRATRTEGAEINKSLLALKECIRAMGRNANHVPFRTSKLTQVLRDSFIGENTKTCMIAMISPSMMSVENTLNTLRYADRLKSLGTDNGTEEAVQGPSPTSDDDDVDEDLNILGKQNGTSQRDLERMKLVTKIEAAEETCLTLHMDFNELANQSLRLQQKTRNVTYDQVEYVRDMNNLIKKASKQLTTMSDQFSEWSKLNQREADLASTGSKGANGRK